MFSEETRANTTRKRQEQAKERRRKLKQQQEDKQNGLRNELVLNHQNLSGENVSSAAIENKVANTAVIQTMPKASASVSVTKALEQRKVRTQQKQLQTSAVIVQAAYRAFQSNKGLLESQRGLLKKRLGDLITLTHLLEKQNKSYVPPPSLVSLMVNQMLFVFSSTPRMRKSFPPQQNCVSGETKLRYFSTLRHLTKDDVTLILNMVRHAILPGVLCRDDHLDPTIVWIESQDGKLRIKKMLRLALYLMVRRQQTNAKAILYGPLSCQQNDVEVLCRLIKELLLRRDSKKAYVSSYCRNFLINPKASGVVYQGRFGLSSEPLEIVDLDLFNLLRSFLLYPSGESALVIPATAERDREKSIPMEDRKRSDVLFRLIVDLVVELDNSCLHCRFVTAIMTTPILNWKIEEKTGFAIADRSSTTIPFFLTCVSALMRKYPSEIAAGIHQILPTADVPLTVCASPPILNLMANIVQFGMGCPSLIGNGDYDKESTLDREAATIFFSFVSILCDQVPLAAFSSRESEMEWINVGGSHLTPVVISTVVRDHCKFLIHNTFVRKIFHIAIGSDSTKFEVLLSQKDAQDKKIESDMIELKKDSAVNVAAKEVIEDTTTGFFQKSKWAKKLSKGMSSIFGANDKKKRCRSGEGVLMNTSTASMGLASGAMKANTKATETKPRKDAVVYQRGMHFDQKLMFAVTRTYATILSRWGGNGTDADFIPNTTATGGSGAPNLRKQATDKIDPSMISLLNALCFSTSFIKVSWALIQTDPSISSDLMQLPDKKRRIPPLRASKLSLPTVGGQLYFDDNIGSVFLLLFNAVFSHALIVTDDTDLHNLGEPLPIHQIRRLIVLLKKILRRACCLDESSLEDDSNHFGVSLVSSSARVMRDLSLRSSRRLLCPPKLWLVDDLLETEMIRCKSFNDYCTLLNTPVMKLCPFLVPFKRRLKLFEKIVSTNRADIQGTNDGHSFRPGVHVHIMRGRVLEDGLTHLNKLGPNLRRRIIVQYVNAAGSTESGLDAGGLFKEFWTDLCAQSFNPNWALFCETEDSNGYLYPNPNSRDAHGSDSIILFEFLGRILGKAIFENITIQPQFAHFFLSFLRGDYNFLNMLSDLSTMDRTLYNNLMFLKTYEGDVSDLCLTFSVTKEAFGSNEEIALIPNGDKLDVTNANKHRYIQLVAKHFVCDKVREQSEAFRKGLWDVIDRRWLRMFNEPELTVLISGPTNGMIDVDDMKANVRYAGGYTMFDRTIQRFWKVLHSFTREQRAELLRFVTSCERPPPLGFGSMNPPFTVQRVPISKDNEKLPTASTCFNILKLPTYSSEKMLKQKLIYAIKSGSGFELT